MERSILYTNPESSHSESREGRFGTSDGDTKRRVRVFAYICSVIVSASRRTDIPAFHTEWFLNRLRAGYCIVTHHTASGIYHRVPLTADAVDCIVFRSKNPAPMLRRLDELHDYDYLFNITMNPYGREMESRVLRLAERIETFRQLSRAIGSQRMIWRYDPVFLSPKYDLYFHRRAFEYLCRELHGWSYKCMIGFIVHHPFVARRIDPLSVKRRETEDIRTMGRLFGEIARRYGHRIETCAEATDLEEFGIGHGACVERQQIEEIVGYRFGKVKESYLRPHCNCMESVDIGHYSTCDNGCLYCYATPERPDMRTDPASPSLDPLFDTRKIDPERIIDLKAASHRAAQMTLF